MALSIDEEMQGRPLKPSEIRHASGRNLHSLASSMHEFLCKQGAGGHRALQKAPDAAKREASRPSGGSKWELTLMGTTSSDCRWFVPVVRVL